MADETTPTTTDPAPSEDPTGTQEPASPADLGDAGKKALDDERKARREAERQLKAVQAQLKEIDDKDKSEIDKLREQLADLTKDRDDHVAKALKTEVAMAKGLTIPQAKFLHGTTREELEAIADEILELSGPPAAPAGSTPPPTTKPSPSLKGGTDPTVPLNSTQLETDLRKALGVA